MEQEPWLVVSTMDKGPSGEEPSTRHRRSMRTAIVPADGRSVCFLLFQKTDNMKEGFFFFILTSEKNDYCIYFGMYLKADR